MSAIENFFATIGKIYFWFLDIVKNWGRFALFEVHILPLYFRRPWRIREILQQMVIVGVGSSGVIIFTGIFTGMVEAVQLYQGFHEFGAENMMGYPIVLSIFRELGPVFAGLMVTSRAISAMAAELGTMRVTEQIDALDTLAVNSKQYLIIPRVVATTISLPILILVFDAMGAASAYLVSIYALGINEIEYTQTINMYLDLSDIYTGVSKGFIFGFLISAIGTYIGYNARGGARGVGQATTNAVVLGAMTVFVMDYFLSSFFLIMGW
jgi:phospholipid/cholesterol/gamma-HCH transport system permease protein